MTDTLVKVENVSKKFCRSLKRSLWYGMQDLGNELIGRRHGGGGCLRTEEFWAVEHVSFELKRGECLGLIGRNGTGKTTLLRMLNGLIKPDVGRINIRGRVSALIALGAGFNPILTGRENIYVNGAVLGLGKHDIDRCIDRIIDFSELADFIDMPVSSYSSGMTVRLGFSIAAHLEPDVLILDEVLAVGDSGFKQKSFNALTHIMKNTAVILVSHSMHQISRLATHALVLKNGVPSLLTRDVDSAIQIYNQQFTLINNRSITGNGKARLLDLRMTSATREPIKDIEFSMPMKLVAALDIDPCVDCYYIRYSIWSRESQNVMQYSSAADQCLFRTTGKIEVTLTIDSVRLTPNNYTINFLIYDQPSGAILLSVKEYLSLEVTGSFVSYAPITQHGEWHVTPIEN